MKKDVTKAREILEEHDYGEEKVLLLFGLERKKVMSAEEEKSCRYFHELISYEMDGQANEEEQYELAKHLFICVDCQITQERYKETDELGKKLAKVFPMEYFKMKPEDFQVPDDIPKGTEEYKNWEKMIKEILEEDQKKRERLERLKKKFGKDPLKMSDEELFTDEDPIEST